MLITVELISFVAGRKSSLSLWTVSCFVSSLCAPSGLRVCVCAHGHMNTGLPFECTWTVFKCIYLEPRRVCLCVCVFSFYNDLRRSHVLRVSHLCCRTVLRNWWFVSWTNRLTIGAAGRGANRTSNKNPSESKKLYVDLLYMSWEQIVWVYWFYCVVSFCFLFFSLWYINAYKTVKIHCVQLKGDF